ncbi:MAG: branched-chain amino acid ABC transporter permease [Nitrososphaerota archaeon]|nr:branched-chain amino acid ABC transporter permease [Nitrososphaerota archaeon]
MKFDSRIVTAIVAFVLLILAPLGLPQYIVSLILITVFYAILSSAWNIVGGFAGQLSLGNTVFLGMGAYISMLMFLDYKIPTLLGVFAAAFLSALVAIGFGILTIRLKGNFFAMATLGLTVVSLLVVDNLPAITGGPAGIAIFPANDPLNLQFPTIFGYYYLMIALLALTIATTVILLRSTHGHRLIATGNDESLAESIGIDTTREKVLAFVLSAVLTSVSGSIYVFYEKFITPDTLFATTLALQIVLMPVIGGMGTLLGPIVGAAIFIPVQNFTISYLGRAFGSLDLVVYAIILIIVVLFAPNGLVALGSKLAKKINSLAIKRKRETVSTKQGEFT